MTWRPICLQDAHRPQLAAHWAVLPDDERARLFGRAMPAAELPDYADCIDFSVEPVFAVLHPVLDIIAAVHCRRLDRRIEAAVSVAPLARYQGLEMLLMQRAISHAYDCGAGVLAFRGSAPAEGFL